MTTLQEMGEELFIRDNLVLIMLTSIERWDQVAAFVALTMHHKMELVQACLELATLRRKKTTIQSTHQHQKAACNNTVMDQSGSV